MHTRGHTARSFVRFNKRGKCILSVEIDDKLLIRLFRVCSPFNKDKCANRVKCQKNSSASNPYP